MIEKFCLPNFFYFNLSTKIWSGLDHRQQLFISFLHIPCNLCAIFTSNIAKNKTMTFLLLFPFGLDHSSSSNLWMWCCLDLRFTHNNPFSVWKNKGLCIERHFVDVLSRFTWYDAANIVCVLCKLSTCNLWAMKAQLLPTYTTLHFLVFLFSILKAYLSTSRFY